MKLGLTAAFAIGVTMAVSAGTGASAGNGYAGGNGGYCKPGRPDCVAQCKPGRPGCQLSTGSSHRPPHHHHHNYEYSHGRPPGAYWFYHRPYHGYRLSCGAAENRLEDRGYHDVEAKDCHGKRYHFSAIKGGRRFHIAMNSRTGEFWRLK